MVSLRIYLLMQNPSKICPHLKPGGVLLGILDGGVPPGSPNPDPVSDQKMSFFTPVLRPDL